VIDGCESNCCQHTPPSPRSNHHVGCAEVPHRQHPPPVVRHGTDTQTDTPSTTHCTHTHTHTHTTCTAAASVCPRLQCPTPPPHTHVHTPAALRHSALLQTPEQRRSETRSWGCAPSRTHESNTAMSVRMVGIWLGELDLCHPSPSPGLPTAPASPGRPLAAPQPRSCSWTASQHIHHQSSDMTHRHTDTRHSINSTPHTHTTCSTTTSIHPRLPRPTPLPHTHMHMSAASRHPGLLHTHTHTATKLHTDTTRRHPLPLQDIHRPQSRACDTGR
jgi:hypothetical protein